MFNFIKVLFDRPKHKPSQVLRCDRILRTSCPRILIGVNGDTDHIYNSKMGQQKLRIDDDKLLSLVKCSVEEDVEGTTLCYLYDNDLKMCLSKEQDNNKDNVFITLSQPSKRTERYKMDPFLRSVFKNVNFDSPEYDEIETFIK